LTAPVIGWHYRSFRAFAETPTDPLIAEDAIEPLLNHLMTTKPFLMKRKSVYLIFYAFSILFLFLKHFEV
jgi:hypothetical protein